MSIAEVSLAEFGGAQGQWNQHTQPEHELEEAVARVVNEQAAAKTAPPSQVPASPRSHQSHPAKLRTMVSSHGQSLGTSASASAMATAAPPPTAAKVTVDAGLVKAYVDKTKTCSSAYSNPVVVKFLDLGGQEVFYPLHSFFISPKGLFILVFNMEHLIKSSPVSKINETLADIKNWINAIAVRVWNYSL